VNTRVESDIYRRATASDVRRVLGELEDVTVAEILATRPTYRDLEDAAISARGDGDLIAREHRELSGSALIVAEILSRVDEDLLDDRD
jgi:hypothetical protein